MVSFVHLLLNVQFVFIFIFMNIESYIRAEDNMTKFETLQELESFYELWTPAQEKSNESFVWFSGVPHPILNAVMHLKTDVDVGGKVDALISRIPAEVPLSFWVHTQNGFTGLRDVLEKKGFHSIGTCPLMAWNVKPCALRNYHIEEANLEIFYYLLATTFHWNEVVKEGFAKLLENVETAESYVIYLDGEPAGTGTLVSKGKSGCVFNVATLPEYQKRGCGRAMMQFLMNRAFLLDLERLILLSSPVAEKLYSDLEFTKCLDIEIYIKQR